MGLAWNGGRNECECVCVGSLNVKASRAASGTFLCASDGAGSGEGGGDVPQLGPTCPAICFRSPAVRTYKRSFERPRNLPPAFIFRKRNANRTVRC